jgi:hypothetical protein
MSPGGSKGRLPKYRANRRAVSAVTPRLAFTYCTRSAGRNSITPSSFYRTDRFIECGVRIDPAAEVI